MQADRLESTLRSHGHRVTKPRRLVWEVLHSTERHLSAPEIIELVRRRDPSVNASSTYRALALLEELGLVRESRLADDASTWEPRHADSVIHLLCRMCGQVTHFPSRLIERLEGEVKRTTAFRPFMVDVRVEGICVTCASDPDQSGVGSG
ncbi:MAG: transcriptional repressor [Acidimicrobiales bacterium]|nr:MAG: transcriptional repressor [Acidimicrobiales bacterium]